MSSSYGLDTPRDNADNWKLAGLCRQHDPDLWFPATDDLRGVNGAERRTYAEPRTICARCDVWEVCRAYALDRAEPYGMWGGLTPRERRRILAKRAEVA